MSTAICKVVSPPPHEDFELQELIDVPTTKERLEAIESRLNMTGHHPEMVAPVRRMSLWARAGDHKVIVGLILAVILGVFALITSAFHSQINEYVDGRVKSQTDPLSSKLNIIDERTSRIEGALYILRGQLIAQKYSSASPKELKAHRDELKEIKATLAQLPLKTSPGYWRVSFQIITLFSRATFDVERVSKEPESLLDNVISNPRGGIVLRENARFVLKNLIQGMIFKNSIVRFDPSVRLANDVFINCVFLFPVAETPPKPLQQIGTELLASDLSKVTLNGS